MAVNLIVNGTTYSYPDYGDTGWGQNATNWATAITNSTLHLDGGTFELTADVNFGSTYGLVSQYYKSASDNPSTAGVLRLAFTDAVSFRNSGNDGNIALQPKAGSDTILTYAGVDLVDVSSVQTLQNKTIASPAFTGTPTIGGNTIWHQGNDGTGSGLDADTLDGNEASAFLTSVALSDLTDATITSPATNALLYYNGSAWVDGTPALDISAEDIGDLNNVSAGSPSTGDVLMWNGSAWTKTSSMYNKEMHIFWEQTTNQTVKLAKFRRAGTITKAIADCESGSFDLTLLLGTTEGGATAITGISGASVSSSESELTASANNTFSSGDRLFFRVANNDSAEDIAVTIEYNYDI